MLPATASRQSMRTAMTARRCDGGLLLRATRMWKWWIGGPCRPSITTTTAETLACVAAVQVPRVLRRRLLVSHPGPGNFRTARKRLSRIGNLPTRYDHLVITGVGFRVQDIRVLTGVARHEPDLAVLG